jgi:prolyl-tRNA editing enzyme YbaK/EbsC (Cys-tRNA(Pro) deacylase)
MLFKAKTGQFFMVVAAGDGTYGSKALKELLGSRVRMADAARSLRSLDFRWGVCPFDLKSAVPVYLDESLKRYPVVYAAAGP